MAAFNNGSPTQVFEVLEVTDGDVILKELEYSWNILHDGSWRRRDGSTDLRFLECRMGSRVDDAYDRWTNEDIPEYSGTP